MIVPFARAVQGFIQVSESTSSIANNATFLECLQKILTFENIDIQDFDGNTCRIISSEDPTNSIFIYTNDTSTYLYQVVKASPALHKNKKIWLCDTYEMEDVAKINDILTRNAKVIMYKNLCFASALTPKPEQKIETKSNFRAREINASDIFGDQFCLKIKCFVNPTEENLTSYALDGSFNFFFPIRIKDNGYGNGDYTLSQAIVNYDDQSQIVMLSDILSKYSPNIKSIEIIPFVPSTFRQTYAQGTSGKIEVSVSGAGQVLTKLSGSATWTDCGIFLPIGHTNCGDGGIQASILPYLYNKQIVQGGGARGFLRTPLGNIEVDFADCRESTSSSAPIECILLDEGWKIDGVVKAQVPPHYLNFYTDNAGQLFIQNLTTNAQELRSLERQNVAKQEEQQYAYEHAQQINEINTIGAVTSSALGGNFLGAFGAVAQGAINAGKIAFEDEFERGKIERDYGRSLAEYRDKISTQSLLASKQGKQISGNITFCEFIKSLKMNYFKLFIETNFSLQFLHEDPYTTTKYTFLTQPDYDYSSSQLPNSYNMNTDQQLNNNCIYKLTSGTTKDLMRNIFGYTGMFSDPVGLNYSISFSLENVIFESDSFNPSSPDRFMQKFSRVLNFPIRRTKKIIALT